MKKNTDELLKILQKSNSVDSYIEKESDNIISQIPLNEYLEKIILDKKLIRSEIIHASYLDRSYAYDILSGKKRPSRDKLLSLLMGMKLELSEVQNLLNQTGYPVLYPRLERDCVLIFGIERHLSIIDINELLFDTKNEQLK